MRITRCRDGVISLALQYPPPIPGRGLCRRLPNLHGHAIVGPLAAGTWQIVTNAHTGAIWYVPTPPPR
ncbi:MAG: hypothetical protein QM820_41700 [Minicystis sp.]